MLQISLPLIIMKSSLPLFLSITIYLSSRVMGYAYVLEKSNNFAVLKEVEWKILVNQPELSLDSLLSYFLQ